MQPISLPFRYIAEVPGGDFDLTQSMDRVRSIRDRGARVIASALAYEDVMVQVLLLSLFREVKSHRALIRGLILQTDWCGFSAKRKLLQATLVNLQITEVAPLV
jgi:hypothetical protein